MNVVRALHRTPNGYPLVWIRNGDRPIVLNVELLLGAGFVFTFDDEWGFRPYFIDISLINQKFFEDVVFAPDDLLLLERIFERKNRRQCFVFDAHVAPRLFKKIFILVSEQNDWLFRMVYKFIREIRLIIKNQRDIILAGNIFGRNDGEVVPWNIAFEQNCFYAPARN